MSVDKSIAFTKKSGELPFVIKTIRRNWSQEPVNRPNGFYDHQLIWVESGSGTFTADGVTATLSPGEGVFTRADVPHRYVGDELYTSWCTFTCAEGLLDYVLGDRRYLFFKAPDFLGSETEAIVEFANGPSSHLSLSAMGYSYIVNFFEAVLKPSDPVVSKIKEYLEQHYGEQITLDDIAESVGMNRFVLCRYYRNHCNGSVMEELKKLRVSKAKRMLSYTSRSIEEIATLCGFGSPSYFSKTFREECSITPSGYRKMRRG